MSSKPMRVIIDITELKNWSGHLTGVQRVVFGIASELQKSNKNVVFCSFNKDTNALVTEDFAPYAAQAARVQEDAVADIPQASRRELARRIALKAYFSLPASVRDNISAETRHKMKNGAKRLYIVGQRSLSATRRLKRKAQISLSNETSPEVITLTGSDVLIIPGRLWDYPEFIAYIADTKEQFKYRLGVVLYDLVPIYQRHTFGTGLTERFAPYLFQSIYYADLLLPISESTKNDTLRFADEMGLHVREIKVIRLGDDLPTENPTKPQLGTILHDGFGLCVGTLEARKNHTLLYYAYKLAAQEGVNLCPTIVIGKPGWLTENAIYLMQNDIEINKKILFVQNVSDNELGWLYKNAQFTVYPSQYEGWGLPIAESLEYGTPCVASNTSSMTEISPLVDAVSPFDSRALMEKLQYYSDRRNSDRKRKEILKNYTPYSWLQTAEQISKYVELLNGNR